MAQILTLLVTIVLAALQQLRLMSRPPRCWGCGR